MKQFCVAVAIACTAVFVQLLLGALVRHFGATLACIGMPACTATGDFIPSGVGQTVHMIHRTFGCIVAIVTTIAAQKTKFRIKARVMCVSSLVRIARGLPTRFRLKLSRALESSNTNVGRPVAPPAAQTINRDFSTGC